MNLAQILAIISLSMSMLNMALNAFWLWANEAQVNKLLRPKDRSAKSSENRRNYGDNGAYNRKHKRG